MLERGIAEKQVYVIIAKGQPYRNKHQENKWKFHLNNISVVFLDLKNVLRILTVFKDDNPLESKNGKSIFLKCV